MLNNPEDSVRMGSDTCQRDRQCKSPGYRPEADKEDFIWAGTFVAHELYQREDGTLGCRIPDTVWNAFKDEKKLDDVKLEKRIRKSITACSNEDR